MTLHIIFGFIAAATLLGLCWCGLIEYHYRRSETRRIEQREAHLERARQATRSNR